VVIFPLLRSTRRTRPRYPPVFSAIDLLLNNPRMGWLHVHAISGRSCAETVTKGTLLGIL
jgi:hypothetical protein